MYVLAVRHVPTSRFSSDQNILTMYPFHTSTSRLHSYISSKPHKGYLRPKHTSHWLRRCPQRWGSSVAAQTPSATSNPIIFSGIQPTGVPHLGNYLGALREWVRLQDSAAQGTKLFFSIVDLHALTLPQDARKLRNWRKESFATLLAVGLDPSRCTIFFQSSVQAHAELFWMLSTVASIGYLSRMTQWKVSMEVGPKLVMQENQCGQNEDNNHKAVTDISFRASSNYLMIQTWKIQQRSRNYVLAYSHTLFSRLQIFYSTELHTFRSVKIRGNTLNFPGTRRIVSIIFMFPYFRARKP